MSSRQRQLEGTSKVSTLLHAHALKGMCVHICGIYSYHIGANPADFLQLLVCSIASGRGLLLSSGCTPSPSPSPTMPSSPAQCPLHLPAHHRAPYATPLPSRPAASGLLIKPLFLLSGSVMHQKPRQWPLIRPATISFEILSSEHTTVVAKLQPAHMGKGCSQPLHRSPQCIAPNVFWGGGLVAEYF